MSDKNKKNKSDKDQSGQFDSAGSGDTTSCN